MLNNLNPTIAIVEVRDDMVWVGPTPCLPAP